MEDMTLSDKQAKRCHTAAGFAFRDGKILLVKHKKLGIWLAPGGHVEENELPHQAAEREFLEETGVKAEAISAYPMPSAAASQSLPLPFFGNLHEINKPRSHTGTFCEQHYGYGYLLRISDDSGLGRQEEEVDDIGWFGRDEIESLETTEDVKNELRFIFDHFPQNSESLSLV